MGFNEEMNAAEAEAKTAAGLYTHKFKNPVLIEGEEIKELVFDFEGLTGEDSLSVENEMQAQGNMVVALEFSGEYLIRMAARACITRIAQGGMDRRIPSDEFRRLPLADYNRIRSKARSFLLRSASE